MIVKNEAQVIARALRSVCDTERTIVDRYSIVVDAETTDNTADIIRQELAAIPGTVHVRPWPEKGGFGAARTEAFQLACAEGCDYALMLDADDAIEGPREAITLSPYYGAWALELLVQDHGTSYWRTQLLWCGKPWRYEGVAHEYPTGVESFAGRIHGLTYRRLGGGHRESLPDKYRYAASLLEKQVELEPDNARSWFYLAQSYRDAGDLQRAHVAYEHRARMEHGWVEETWYAKLEAAKLSERLANPYFIVMKNYLEAYERRPVRAEPLVYLSRYLERCGHQVMAAVFREKAEKIPRPNDSLFVDDSCYAKK